MRRRVDRRFLSGESQADDFLFAVVEKADDVRRRRGLFRLKWCAAKLYRRAEFARSASSNRRPAKLARRRQSRLRSLPSGSRTRPVRPRRPPKSPLHYKHKSWRVKGFVDKIVVRAKNCVAINRRRRVERRLRRRRDLGELSVERGRFGERFEERARQAFARIITPPLNA